MKTLFYMGITFCGLAMLMYWNAALQESQYQHQSQLQQQQVDEQLRIYQEQSERQQNWLEGRRSPEDCSSPFSHVLPPPRVGGKHFADFVAAHPPEDEDWWANHGQHHKMRVDTDYDQ